MSRTIPRGSVLAAALVGDVSPFDRDLGFKLSGTRFCLHKSDLVDPRRPMLDDRLHLTAAELLAIEQATAVLDTGRTLVSILRQRLIQLDPQNITLATPADFTNVRDRPGVTVFLYRVSVNAHMRNESKGRRPDGSLVRPPLPVELAYLVTPWSADDKESEQILVGEVLQAFYDHSELGPTDLLGDSWEGADSVQLVLDTLPLEDHYRIWDTTTEPYRLSLTYTARVVGIDPTQAQMFAPVVNASLER